MLLLTIVRTFETVWSAKNKIIQHRSDIIGHIKRGENELAALKQGEIKKLKEDILRRFQVIIDY